MPTKELVITLSRFIMLSVALIILFLAAMITHRPVIAQNGGGIGDRVARTEYQIESQQQSLARIESKLQRMEEQLQAASVAFIELKTVVYTGAGLLAFLLAGQLVVSLRKKP